MFRLATSNTLIKSISRNVLTKSRGSTTPMANAAIRHKSFLPKQQNPLAENPLAAEAGPFATHIYHNLTTGILFLFPLYVVLPEDGMLSKVTGLALTIPFAIHSWIGLNSVGGDYFPKLSKYLLQPARVFFAGMCLITMLGLTHLQLNGPGGMKGAYKALWKAEAIKKQKEAEAAAKAE